MKYIIIFFIFLTSPCYSDSMSIYQGPYYGTNHTELNFSSIGVSYDKKLSERLIVSPELIYLSEVKTDYQMFALSTILKYYWLNKDNWKSYGLIGGGVAFIDYDAESDGNMLFNLETGIGIEYKFNQLGVFGEGRLKHQSNAYTGENYGQDTYGFQIGCRYYF